jgi:hypothetical protein
MYYAHGGEKLIQNFYRKLEGKRLLWETQGNIKIDLQETERVLGSTGSAHQFLQNESAPWSSIFAFYRAVVPSPFLLRLPTGQPDLRLDLLDTFQH